MAEDKDKPVNDRREGIVRDPVNWKGQIVSYVKDVGNGDPGYNANLRQVVIMLQDGTEHVVPESEIMRERKVASEQANELDRRPDQTLPKSLEGKDEGADQKNRQARAPADEHNPAAKQDAAQPKPHVPQQQRADAPLGGRHAPVDHGHHGRGAAGKK